MSAKSDARRARRELVLNELGLTPLWRIREANAPEAAQLNQACTEIPAVGAGPAEIHTAHVDQREDRRAKILRMGWEQLQTSVAGCVACPLCESRSRTVFGVGDPNADWLCVGEGPGAQEDATGEPFVGLAGQLLDNMLAAIDLKRGRNVFITNIVKCRPPGNREPTPDEAQSCEPYLARQIELIRPRLIIALGKIAGKQSPAIPVPVLPACGARCIDISIYRSSSRTIPHTCSGTCRARRWYGRICASPEVR